MYERPKGTRDFGPEEMARRRWLEGVFGAVARRFGYREVATPTFEHAELFIAKSGPGVVDEMYTFRDKAGRELALRPELTAPVIRFYLHELQARPKPLKLFYLGPAFRYDEPQFGRYREHFQFGVEILGADPLEADAEVVATGVTALREAGLEGLELRLGHVGLVRGLLGRDETQTGRILNRLDKRDLEGLRRELDATGLLGLADLLLELVEIRGGRDVLAEAGDLLAGAEASGTGGEGQPALSYLEALANRLADHGVEDVVYDLGLVRGLDYYTGMVFEIHHAGLGTASQLCGGGGYSLTDVFGGEPLPTTGFGMGIDRVLLALERSGAPLPVPFLDALVVPVGDHMRKAGYQVLRLLREAGVSADIDLVGRGPSKNLEYAGSVGARFAVLVGEREWKRGKVALKDLGTGEQREVSRDNLAAALTAH